MTNPDALSAINIDDYTYPLSDEQIAKFPLSSRDQSKLLIYDGNAISEDKFHNLARRLPKDTLLVMNNTRVVHARIFFRKQTGALIEVFCLEPVTPATEIETAFQQKKTVVWKCLVGNARRWKSGTLKGTFGHGDQMVKIEVENLGQHDDAFSLKFTWQPEELSFAEVLENAGKIPLPPYIHRDATASDHIQYQTVYAQYDGSVAAPTAGLHFTPKVLSELESAHIKTEHVTLHVGAGTFKPVSSQGISHHIMHTEQMIVSRRFIENLAKHRGKVVAVGTTSVRTLESLYWFGMKLKDDPKAAFSIRQFDPYTYKKEEHIPASEALQNILNYLGRSNTGTLKGATQLLITPGYTYCITGGMVTNFHQPRSTLLLLIAAFLGDKWKEIYTFALRNNFRFLSYGDACLFL
jgi:S-adenosylmethionine:tRNA ribosyltransferase-isomerase